MHRIQMAALILGLTILLTRAPGLFSPKALVEWLRAHILRRDDTHLRFYGFSALVIGGFMIFLMWNEVEWMQAITVALVLLVTLKGFLMLCFPDIMRSTVRAFGSQHKLAIRLLCLLGVILSLYLICFGLRGYW